jgi:hypothetical protein
MARIRTIKPEFFGHEQLFDLERDSGLPARLSFAGLWTQCDREGRFDWRPRTLKAAILPFDDIDFSRVLDALASGGFVVRYALGGEEYGYIPSWKKHQFVNNKERQSYRPKPQDSQQLDATPTGEPRDDDATDTRGVKEGKGKEGKGKEIFSNPPSFPNKNPEPDDGQQAFNHSVGLFPVNRRSYSANTQTLYFQAIGELRGSGLSDEEAVAKMNRAITAYVAKEGEFCFGFERFLRDGVWKGYLATASNKTPSLAEQDAKNQARLKAVSGMNDEEYGKHRQEMIRRRRGE